MKSPVVKRSIVIDGRKTSISIEELFWVSLKKLAQEKRMTLSAMATDIKAERGEASNLSSAIRVYVLRHFLTRTQETTQVASLPGVAPPATGFGGNRPAFFGRLPGRLR